MIHNRHIVQARTNPFERCCIWASSGDEIESSASGIQPESKLFHVHSHVVFSMMVLGSVGGGGFRGTTFWGEYNIHWETMFSEGTPHPLLGPINQRIYQKLK